MFGYAVAANAIYGGTLQEYSSIFSTFIELLRILLLDFHYDRMYSADPTISAVFFSVYVV